MPKTLEAQLAVYIFNKFKTKLGSEISGTIMQKGPSTSWGSVNAFFLQIYFKNNSWVNISVEKKSHGLLLDYFTKSGSPDMRYMNSKQNEADDFISFVENKINS